MADVFISYAREDRERVKLIVEAIEGKGYSVWWDRRIGVGRSFDREIERELDSCACVVVVWSNESVERDWVRNEAQEGFNRGILVPILIDEVKQPLAFRRVQAARLFTDDDQELTRLLEAVASVMAAAAEGSSGRDLSTQKGGPGPGDSAPVNAIAVLPFDDLNPAGDLKWFTEGLAEELIDSLSRIEGLRIPARNSTSALKELKAGAEKIGERLAVGSLVTGSVRQTGERILVSVQWVRLKDQTSIWSARFDKSFDDILEIQRELAGGISEAIRKELGIHDTAEFVSRDRYQTSDVRAWEAFRRGFSLVFTFNPSKMAEGREYLHQALEIDPDYLEARAWLAWSDFDRPDKRNEESLRVLGQQPSNPVALCSLIADSETQWDFETAEQLWRYAVTNNPVNDQLTLVGYHLSCCLGALDETLEVTRRGVRLDPLWPAHHFFLGRAYLNLGDPESAIDPIRKAISLRAEIGDLGGLNQFWIYQYLAIALQSMGREGEAIDALQMGFRPYREQIADGARTGGWHGANLALINASPDFPKGHPYRLARVHFKAAVFASVAERELMYGQLSESMNASDKFPVRDRDAMRAVQALADSLRANAVFQPYWEESEFKSLKQQLEERTSRSAGIAGYADLIR